MSMRKVIAERRLVISTADGTRDVHVRIGEPYWITENEEAACPVAVSGVREKLLDMHGVDLLQALELAQGLANMLLENEVKKGAKLTWPGGGDYFDSPSRQKKVKHRRGNRKKGIR